MTVVTMMVVGVISVVMTVMVGVVTVVMMVVTMMIAVQAAAGTALPMHMAQVWLRLAANQTKEIEKDEAN